MDFDSDLSISFKSAIGDPLPLKALLKAASGDARVSMIINPHSLENLTYARSSLIQAAVDLPYEPSFTTGRNNEVSIEEITTYNRCCNTESRLS